MSCELLQKATLQYRGLPEKEGLKLAVPASEDWLQAAAAAGTLGPQMLRTSS